MPSQRWHISPEVSIRQYIFNQHPNGLEFILLQLFSLPNRSGQYEAHILKCFCYLCEPNSLIRIVVTEINFPGRCSSLTSDLLGLNSAIYFIILVAYLHLISKQVPRSILG